MFRPFRAGLDATAANPDLDPEKLVGAELGGEYEHGDIRLSVTGFFNKLKNAIANVTLGQGPGVFPGVGFVAAGGAYRQRENVDAVKVHGIEAIGFLGARAVAGAGRNELDSRANGSERGAAFLDGLRPAQTPNFAATLSFGYDQDGKGAQIVLRRVQCAVRGRPQHADVEGGDHVDAFASWPITQRLQIIARGENITNKLVMAGINGDGSVERATPRTLWIGLRLR